MKKEEDEWKTKEDRWTIKKRIDLKEVRRRKKRSKRKLRGL